MLRATEEEDPSMTYRYGVFTVMLPELTPETAGVELKRHGYEGIEWRVTDAPAGTVEIPGYWSGNRCTLDIRRLDAELPRVRGICESNGLRVPALGTYLAARDAGSVRRCMEFALALDCPQIRVGVPGYDGSRPYGELYDEGLRDWETVASLAEETGVRANVELHMGNICPSAGLAHRFVSRFDPKHVGVVYDPGNMVVEGYERWQMGMELLGPYLAHIHAKNTEWRYGAERGGTVRFQPHWTAIQEGIVPWDEVYTALDRVGYRGWICFEDFSEIPWERKLRDNLAYLKGWERKPGNV